MTEFNFVEKNLSESTFSEVAKDIEAKMVASIGGSPEKSKEEYALIAAQVLFERFGGKRQELEAEYIVSEAVVIAMASKAAPKGFIGPMFEQSIRLTIRMNINGMESAAEE